MELQPISEISLILRVLDVAMHIILSRAALIHDMHRYVVLCV